MRVLIAGVIGGIVMFLWGAVAHMALPLGEIGIRQPANENVVLSTLHEGLGAEPGVYMLPSLAPDKMSDPAAVKTYADKAKASPYAWVVYLPQGEDLTQMGRQLQRQWASDTLAALALAFLMGWAGLGFRRRLAIAGVAALFAWLSVLAPYWNWYRFPLDLSLSALVEQVVGWLLAGAAMGWWIGRREPRRTF